MGRIDVRVIDIASSHFDVRHGSPADPSRFREWLDVHIEGYNEFRVFGGEIFSLAVCTPEWLMTHVNEESPLWGHRYLVVQRWNYDVIEQAVVRLCASLTFGDWNSAVSELSRYMEADPSVHGLG